MFFLQAYFSFWKYRIVRDWLNAQARITEGYRRSRTGQLLVFGKSNCQGDTQWKEASTASLLLEVATVKGSAALCPLYWGYLWAIRSRISL